MLFSVRKVTNLNDKIQKTLETEFSILFFDTWISNKHRY